MIVGVTVTDDLLNTKLLSPVSRRPGLSQPVQSPNYMQCEQPQVRTGSVPLHVDTRVNTLVFNKLPVTVTRDRDHDCEMEL
jgi:hypothetical protein